MNDKVTLLMSASRILAISSMIPFLNRFPVMENMINDAEDTKNWDFFMTVAAVYAGILNYSVKFSNEEIEDMSRQAEKQLEDWNQFGATAFGDLKVFYRRNVEAGIHSHEAIGLWVIWNIKKSEPTKKDMELCNALGFYIFSAMRE